MVGEVVGWVGTETLISNTLTMFTGYVDRRTMLKQSGCHVVIKSPNCPQLNECNFTLFYLRDVVIKVDSQLRLYVQACHVAQL